MCLVSGILNGWWSDMSKAFKVWVEYSSFSKVMKSEEMRDAVYQAARTIASRDPNFSASSFFAKSRAVGTVWDNSPKITNNLLKAVR